MKFQTFLPLAIVGLSLGTASVASAAITVTNDTGTTTTVDSGSDQTNRTTTLANWSLGTGGNTIAVFFSGEGEDLSSATYGGQTMTIVQATGGGRWTAAIAYLINPAVSTGDIVLNWTDSDAGVQNEIGYTPFALGGVGGVAGSASNDNGNDLNFGYSTSLDGGYVLGVATNNQFDGSPTPSVSGRPDTFEFSGGISGNFATIHVHGDVPTAGSYTDTYSGDVESAASVAFNPIPEPSAALLGVLGSLLLLRRRRN